MSIAPIMYDFAREMENFKKSVLSDFELGFYPHQDIFKMSSMLPIEMLPMCFFHPPFLRYPFEQLHQITGLPNANERMTIDNKEGFEVTVDAKEFKPNELTVKTVNNFVVIEGKHEERKDDKNFTKKHFSRTYLLPNGYNADEVVSTISSDGVLCVKVPPPPPQRAIECKERMVKIKETGSTYSAIKDKSY